ncbi:MAG: single-stranded DNA-binding protein [Spirosomataceae bacterium]
MKGLNKVTLIGNLGNDPTIQHLEGNVTVAKFSLATSENFKDSNGQNQTITIKQIKDTRWSQNLKAHDYQVFEILGNRTKNIHYLSKSIH